MFSLTWIGDSPDAQNFLQLFFSENASPGPNRANFVDPAFDQLYRRLAQMPATPEREALCREGTIGDKLLAVIIGVCISYSLSAIRRSTSAEPRNASR